jgi:hypothetical protein
MLNGVRICFHHRGSVPHTAHHFRPATTPRAEVWTGGDKELISFPAAPYPAEKEVRLTLVSVWDTPLPVTTDYAPGEAGTGAMKHALWQRAVEEAQDFQDTVVSRQEVHAVFHPVKSRDPCDRTGLKTIAKNFVMAVAGFDCVDSELADP